MTDLLEHQTDTESDTAGESRADRRRERRRQRAAAAAEARGKRRAYRRRRILQRLGWYRIQDQPVFSSTRQVECLDAALMSTRPPVAGPAAGVDDVTGATVTLDLHELYELQGGSPNALVCGDVDQGKSTFVKNQYCIRPYAIGTRVATFDRKPRGPEEEAAGVGGGEYTELAHALCGQVVRFDRRQGVGARVNILDPNISMSLGTDQVGQDELLLMVAEEAMGKPLEDTPDFSPRYALRVAHYAAVEEAREAGRVAVLSDVIRHLYTPAVESMPGPVDESGEKVLLRDGVMDRSTLTRWGMGVAMSLERYIAGDLSGIIDGESVDEHGDPLDLSNPFLVIDTSGLPDESPVLGLVMAIMTGYIMGRWARVPGKKILVVEEAYNVAKLARVVGRFRRLAKQGRGFGTAVVTVLHHLSDIPRDSDMWSLIRECGVAHIYRQDKHDDAQEAMQLWQLPPSTVETLMTLEQGVQICIRGRDYETILLRHRRTALEAKLNDTEAGMRGEAVAAVLSAPITDPRFADAVDRRH